jgi:broad specificity phosphatase PhoE
MKITLIRHAQSEGNVDRTKYLSKGNEGLDLTEEGIKSAENLSKEFFLNRCDLVVTSPFLRAKRTAEIITQNKNLRIIENPLLVERNWGEFKYKTEFTDQDFKFFNRPKDGESFFDLYQRVVLFYNFLKNDFQDNYLAVVTHFEWMMIFDMFYRNVSIEDFEKSCRSTNIPNCEYYDYYF